MDPRDAANRDLLFGLLALQTGVIDQGALFTAFNVWTREKTRSMAEILVDQGDLDAPRRTLLEGLVAVHLKMHGDDPEKSLAAIEAGRSTRERLAQINDPELAASVALIGSSHQPFEFPQDQSRPIAVTPASDGPPSDRQEQRLAEQHGRWAQGERVLVEAFLERDPDLRDDPDALLDLIYNEVVLRERRGEALEPDEYTGRFPELKDAIRNQFEIHRMFAGQGTESGSGDADRPSTFSVGTSSSRGLRFRVLRPHRSGGMVRFSSRSTPSCTVRSRSSRSSTGLPTTPRAAGASWSRPRSPAASSTPASSPSTAWAAMRTAGRFTPCGLSGATASKTPSPPSTPTSH